MVQDPQKQDPIGPTRPPVKVDPDVDRYLAQDPDIALLAPVFEPIGYEMSQRAQGFLENVEFQASAAAKGAGDGMLNVVHGVHKLTAGLGAGIASKLAGEEFIKGWDYGVDDVREQLRQMYGSEDPSILDWMSSLRNGGVPQSAAVYNPESGTVEQMSVGKAGDKLIQSRLGNMAALGQTIGALTSFATGPGAIVGKGGSAVAGIVTKRIDSAIARGLAKEAGVGIETAIKNGDALHLLGQMPEWKAAATGYQKLLRTGGRLFTESLDLTAANVAQSYLADKDEDRMHGMIAAAATSWAAGPLARLGQKIGNQIMTSGLLRSPELTAHLGDIYGKMAMGKLSVDAADKLIRQAAPTFGRKLFANALSSSIEGTAFLSLPQPGEQPDAWDLWKQWQKGDPDAGTSLFAMWLGSIGGIAATKYAVPHNLAPMFKSLRPDLNTLKIHMEAEGYRRFDAASQARDVEQEGSGLDQRDNAQAEAQSRARDVEQEAARQDTATGSVGALQEAAKRFGRRSILEQQMMDARRNGDEIITAPRREQADPLVKATEEVASQYGWAEEWTGAPLRAGWEPEFLPAGDVRLSFGRDAHALLERNSGATNLVLNGKAMEALRAFGREPKAVADGNPDVLRVDPAATEKTLDDLALVGWARSMQGTALFERLGMKEVGQGIWHNEDTGAWHTIDLDGRMRTRMPQDKGWSGPTDLVAVGGFTDRNFATEGLDALKNALSAKVAISPDAMVDTVLTHAINLAEHSNSEGAKELRQFFSIMDPVEIRSMLTTGRDEWLAYTLGSLGTGNNNARNAAREVMLDADIDVQQESSRARLMKAQKESRLATDQKKREQFVEQVQNADVPDRKTGKAKMGTGVAETLRRWLPDIGQPAEWKSAESEVVKASDDEGPLGMGSRRQVHVTAGELRRLAEAWTKKMAERRQEPFDDTPASQQEEIQIAAVDDWFSAAAERMGMKGIGETGEGVAMGVPRDPKAPGEEPPRPTEPRTPEPDPVPQDRAPEEPKSEKVAERPVEPKDRVEPEGKTETPPKAVEPVQEAARPVRDLPTSDTEANRDSFKQEYEKAAAKLKAMKRLPQAQRATKATSRAMDELAAKAERLRRKVSALDRQIKLERNRAGRTPEEQAALSERMRSIRRKPETAHAYVAKSGGIKVDVVDGRKVAPKGWPLDSAPEVLAMKVGGKPMFSQNGRPWEHVVHDLIEGGFFPGQHIHGGDASATAPHELLQEWFDSGDSMHSENDKAAEVEQMRQFAAENADRAKAARQEGVAEKKRQRAIELASKKRGVSRRLSDVAKLEQASDAAKARNDAKLPEVTPEQVAHADEILQDERMRIDEGEESTLSAEDFLALTRGASDKQRVALANELTLEGHAKMLRRQGNDAEAGLLDNLLLTGGAEQIAKKVAEVSTREVGSMNPMQSATRGKVMEAIKKGGRKAIDWFMTDRLEVLERAAPGQFLDEFKAGRSRQRHVIGEGQVRFSPGEQALRKMKSRSMATEMIDGEIPTHRWTALAEDRIQPANENEAAAAKGLREMGLYLWDLSREAGVRRGQWDPELGDFVMKPLPARDRFTMPRTTGADYDAFMGPKENRLRLFRWLIDHNDMKIAERHPETGKVLMDGGEPVLRPMEPEDLEARWVEPKGQGVQSAEEQAAFEFVRQVKNFPAVFDGHILLERNPFEAVRRMLHEQAGRIATIEQWGQDFTAKQRLAIETADGIKLPPGAEAELRRYQETIDNTSTASEAKDLRQIANDLLVTLQGTNPKKLSAGLRALQSIESFVRASMTWKSFIQDIPAPMLQGSAYAGWRRMGKAIANVTRSPREAMLASERVGSLFRNTGFKDPIEADSTVQRFGDRITWLSMQSERIKTAMFDRMAVEMTNDWANGRVTGNDRDVLAEMLRFNSAEQDLLTSGKAPEDLKIRFRHEFVKLTTGRRLRVEGSQFMASPNLQALVRFGNWISGRMVEMQRLGRGLGPGRTGAQRARAAGRIMQLATGYAVLGTAIGTTLSYLIADAFKGENGLDRMAREFSYAPAAMMGKALLGQVTGGPTAQALEAIRNPDNVKQWTNLIAPLGMGYALVTKLHQAWEQSSGTSPGDIAESVGHALWTTVAGTAVEMGAVPTDAKNLAALLQGWYHGQDPAQRRDEKMVQSFKRVAGIESPDFPRTKAPAFYEALGNIRRAIGRHANEPDGVKLALKEAAADLQTALGLEQEEAVAQSVRSFQHLDGVSLEDRQKLADYAGDDGAMARIFSHDLAVRELATAIGHMHGHSPTALDNDLEAAKSQARLGASDVWSKLVDRVTDDAVVSLAAGTGVSGDLRKVAEAMAPFPQTLAWLSPKQRAALSRQDLDRATRARMLQTIMSRRALDRMKSERRAEAKQ